MLVAVGSQAQDQRKVLLEQIMKLQVYLGYLRKGYNIVQSGLTFIGDIKDGDFKLHQLFFDRLKQVNPKIKKYAKVAEIISMQIEMLSAYKDNLKKIRQSGMFSNSEIDFLHNSFNSFIDDVSTDIQQLTDIVTDGKFEMNDNERIDAINSLYNSMLKKYNSFFAFTNKISVLAKQRKAELNDLKTLKQLYVP